MPINVLGDLGQLAPDDSITAPIMDCGYYAYVSYSKGDETSVDFTFSVWDSRNGDGSKSFNIIQKTNPCELYKISLTASGDYLIPIPVPPLAGALNIKPTFVGGTTGVVDVTVQTDDTRAAPPRQTRIFKP